LLRSEDASRLGLRLAYKAPLDWQSLLAFLRARAIPGVEHVGSHAYQRTITLGGVQGVIDVRPAASGASFLELRVPAAFSPHLLTVAARIGRVFDLGADPAAIDDHLAQSPRLAPLVARRPGLRVPGAWDGFELAVRAVLGQQITVAGATTLSGRLVMAAGEALSSQTPTAEGLTHLFPTPAALADADLASIGLPRARAETLRALAVAARDRMLTLDMPPSVEAERASLAAIPGIGPWTVEYVALRAFAEPDAFPASDLALRKALSDGAELPSERAVAELCEPFRPFRGYAAMHLWNSLSDPEKK
jgi:AraC family transcriptional regulator of adaptative response / DNA-3-methyladenine glycosylase II